MYVMRSFITVYFIVDLNLIIRNVKIENMATQNGHTRKLKSTFQLVNKWK
jgi:hypothetical protein